MKKKVSKKSGHAPGEVRYDPKWTRRSANDRPVKAATLPVKPTRQLLRAATRRADRQPIGMPQRLWHERNDMPKVIAAHKRRGGKAQSHKRIIHSEIIGGREVQLHATKGYRSYRK